ncbi:MAG: hypothetical protein IJU44_08775 [Kiritimatiellae bacterium]|nr:hypothetical protein [Kiritimatiellia bacterium]
MKNEEGRMKRYEGRIGGILFYIGDSWLECRTAIYYISTLCCFRRFREAVAGLNGTGEN